MGNCCGGKKQPGDQEPKRKTTIETKDPKDDEENPGPAAKVGEEEQMEAPQEQDTPEDYGEENDSNYKPSSEEYDTPDDEAPTPPPESVADLGAEVSKNFSACQEGLVKKNPYKSSTASILTKVGERVHGPEHIPHKGGLKGSWT